MNRVCPGCPTLVPLVSPRLAETIGLRLAALGNHDPRGRTAARLDVLGICLSWLGEPNPLLRLHRGITGRAYTRQEKDLIAVEVHAIEAMPCPFAQAGMCVLGGQGTVDAMAQDEMVGPWGWLPSLLAAAIDQKSVTALVRKGMVADAKLATLTRRHSFPVLTSGGLAIASSLPKN